MFTNKFTVSLVTDCTGDVTMYGLESRNNGSVYSYPSLSSDRERVLGFIGTLNKADFPFDVLPELVEDFVEDLYG